jgi:hypothetical protein
LGECAALFNGTFAAGDPLKHRQSTLELIVGLYIDQIGSGLAVSRD